MFAFAFTNAQIEISTNKDNLSILVQDDNLVQILNEKNNNCKANFSKGPSRNNSATGDIVKSNTSNAKKEKDAKAKEVKSKNVEPVESEAVEVVSKPKINVNDVCKGREKIDGFKIKVFTTKSADEARNTLLELVKLYPRMTTPEILALRPDYHVMIGDYISKNAASKDLNTLKQKYPNAVISPARVFCRRAVMNGL